MAGKSGMANLAASLTLPFPAEALLNDKAEVNLDYYDLF